MPAFRHRTMTIVLETHTSTPDVQALEPEWKALLEDTSVSSPFLTWEWVWTWWQTFSARSQPWVVTARDSGDGRLVALAPFVLRARALPGRPRYRDLTFMGSNSVSPDHLDIPVLPGYEQPVASKLVAHLEANSRRWDVLHFDGVSGGSLLLLSLLQRTRPLWWTSSHVSCPFIRLPRTWEEYNSTLNQKLRRNLRSRERRLQRDTGGNAGFRTASDAREVADALSALFALHDESWGKRGIPSVFTEPLITEFHRRVAGLFHQNGWLRLQSLYVGDEPIAAAYCLLYRGVTYFYQTAFHPSWARYGPGAAMLACAIKRSIEDGATEFDFLRGSEPYKLQWTDESRADVRAHLASTSKGKLLISGYRVRQRLRERRADKDGQPGVVLQGRSVAYG